MGLNGKTVVVTGGVFGIGRIISEYFAKAGADVVIGDIAIRDGEKYAKKLSEKLGSVCFFSLDVSKEKSVLCFLKLLKKRHGKIDVIINNAGVGGSKDIRRRTLSEWHRIVDTNLTGPFMLVKYSLPLMRKGSSVINIASTRALMSEANTEPYSASKGGLLALTHALSLSLATAKIRVNAISPGWIDVSAYGKKGKTGQIKLKAVDKLQHPVGRVGRPEDIAEVCLFLADVKKSGFITGQNLVVDGGMTKKMIYE